MQPWPAESTSNVVKELKQRSAHAILEALRAGSGRFTGAKGADLERKVCANLGVGATLASCDSLPSPASLATPAPFAGADVKGNVCADLTDAVAAADALRAFRLPRTVHDQAHYRVWQRRFIPFNVFTEKKRLEKLDYMHNNPVKRGLVASPGDWPWSSWRFYHLDDRSVLGMDRLRGVGARRRRRPEKKGLPQPDLRPQRG